MSQARPLPDRSPDELVTFCGYCAARPDQNRELDSRVCSECNMGLLLRAAADTVPSGDQPFVVVDELLAVRAVSRRAEKLLRITETAAVDRPISALLDAVEPDGGSPAEGLAAALAGATVAGSRSELALRPGHTYGVRWWARIAPCAPGRAAIVVLTERL